MSTEPPPPADAPPAAEGPSSAPDGADEDVSEREQRRRGIERALRDLVRKALERGLEVGLDRLGKTNSAIGEILGSGQNLSREVVGFVFAQLDETKNALVRVVAREVREFLEATDIAAEVRKALTSLSFEIRTEIRFVPNEAGALRPEIRSRPTVAVRRRDRESDGETTGDG
ncbi:MAG: hypothetical protein NZ898_02235 [Myxococcota bacterium]|nr:hypothetical protein [Myxococcota bacterium]